MIAPKKKQNLKKKGSSSNPAERGCGRSVRDRARCAGICVRIRWLAVAESIPCRHVQYGVRAASYHSKRSIHRIWSGHANKIRLLFAERVRIPKGDFCSSPACTEGDTQNTSLHCFPVTPAAARRESAGSGPGGTGGDAEGSRQLPCPRLAGSGRAGSTYSNSTSTPQRQGLTC